MSKVPNSFETLDAAVNDVKAAQVLGGFAVRRSRSVQNKQGTAVRRVDLTCSRGGKLRPSRSTGQRQKSTMNCGCRWAASVTLNVATGRWFVTEKDHEHNHPGAKENTSIPALRRDAYKKKADDILQCLESLAASTTLTSRQMATHVADNFGVSMSEHDIRNQLQKLRVDRLGPYTSTQIFVDALQDFQDDVSFAQIHRNEDTGKIDAVFWTYNWCVEMLRKFGHLLVFDCTYRVNCFDMPLLQITTSTNLGTNVALGFCLVSHEDTETFTWALNQLQSLLERENIPVPGVIISDFDKAFKHAATDVFPTARQQLCLWHIIKNVILHVKKKWNGTLDGTRLMASDGAGSLLPGQRDQGLCLC